MMIAPKHMLAAAAMAGLATLTACGSSTGSAAQSPSTSSSSSAPSVPSLAPGTAMSAEQIKALALASYARLTTVHEHLSMVGRTTMTADADIAKTGDGLAMDMTMTLPQIGEMQARLVNKTFYIKSAAMQMGDKWIAIDLTDQSNPLYKMLSSFTSMSPDKIFDQYAGGVTGGRYIGKDADGEHYEMTIDSAKAAASLPEGMKSNEALVQGFKALPATVKMNLWLQDGVMHKSTMNLGTAGTITVVLSNYGQPVQVVAPPSSEVTSMPGMG